MELVRHGPFLLVRFAAPQRVASWAIMGGGLTHADAVAWLEVRNADLPIALDPRVVLQRALRELALGRVVGLITSRSLDAYQDVSRTHGGVSARAVATIGLGNALRAGDAPSTMRAAGTINVLCQVSVRLSDEALLEALALATEAKTLAVCDARVPSTGGALLASGTGTDCVVIACAEHGEAVAYAGKHTVAGHLIGSCIHDAVARGIAVWQHENAGPTG
jgi:adenosylcobinamide amidohydrolase